MENLKELQRYVGRHGWFSGRLSLNILLENEFEGFYGLASESWETRVTIELNQIKDGDKIISPSLKIVGKRWEDIDKVAKRVLDQLKEQGYIK